MRRLLPNWMSPRAAWIAGVCLVVLVTLAPWVRNRGYVRSFFDYGVVMGGVGRIEDGQRPYVDFVTPIQTGWFLFNWAAEKIGGGTFQAMTWSAAFAIVAAVAVLGRMLAHRWPPWAALLVAGSIACATVSQHTIFWYNPWGVVLLGVTIWAGALAPVLARRDLSWNMLAGAALFLGGINKINMQLMAIGIGAGWAIRALITGRAGFGRTVLTLAYYLLCGTVLPVLAEMGWTGASFPVWWHNVVAQMAAERSGMILSALSWRFYVTPCHDYYGQLVLPQVGLVGVALTVLVVSAILYHTWRGASVLERVLPILCGGIALLGGVVLLTTNMDIAYIGLGGWMVLLIALWLGYGLPSRGGWFLAAIILPAIVVGAVSWDSAWIGQRSQFGYSKAPRADYISGDQAGAAFGYLRGTRLPPEMIRALSIIGRWHKALPPARRNAVLYGPGSEWAAHIWPAPRTPGLPLYILGGRQFGPDEYAATYTAISGNNFQEILVSLVLDIWEEKLQTVLKNKYARSALGGNFYHYSRIVGDQVSSDPLAFVSEFGGSTDSRKLDSAGMLLEAAPHRMFVGTTAGEQTMLLTVPTNRLRGEVIVRRNDPKFTGPVAAEFAIYARHDEKARYERWTKKVELPAGQNAITVDYAIDSSHMPTLFTVRIPPELSGKVAAGWRGPYILHAGEDGPANPRWLYHPVAPITALTPEQIASVMPPGWRPSRIVMRGGKIADGAIELDAGGEIWIRAEGLVTHFSGTAQVPRDRGMPYAPVVRGLWMKDARFEVFSQMSVRESDRTAEFHGWGAEPGGWLIVAIDPVDGTPATRVRITHVTRQD